MVRRQRFSVVGSPEGADAELSGAVTGYGATPVTFDPSGRATEYEISLTAQITFKRLATDKVIWSNDHYTFRQSYPLAASGAGISTRRTRRSPRPPRASRRRWSAICWKGSRAGRALRSILSLFC